MTRHDIIYFCATHVPHIFIFPILILSSKSLMWFKAIVRPSGVVGPFTQSCFFCTNVTAAIHGSNFQPITTFTVFIYSIPIRLKHICEGNVTNFFNHGDLTKTAFTSFDAIFRKHTVKRDGKWFQNEVSDFFLICFRWYRRFITHYQYEIDKW